LQKGVGAAEGPTAVDRATSGRSSGRIQRGNLPGKESRRRPDLGDGRWVTWLFPLRRSGIVLALSLLLSPKPAARGTDGEHEAGPPARQTKPAGTGPGGVYFETTRQPTGPFRRRGTEGRAAADRTPPHSPASTLLCLSDVGGMRSERGADPLYGSSDGEGIWSLICAQ
jgi:hypothetical protein